jgi:alkylation response protein AidB-like acyl-CoA dehydrogenase
LLGLNVPETLGGAGVDAVGAALAIEELGWADGGTALSVSAHNGLGCAPIALFGTPDQQARWLPGLAKGEGGLAALALTEPAGGSDLAGSVHTRAERQGGGWVLNGAKAWITNASVAEVIVTLARTDPAAGKHGFHSSLCRGMRRADSPPRSTSWACAPRPPMRSPMTASASGRLPAQAPGDGLPQAFQIIDGGRISIGALWVGSPGPLEEALRYLQRSSFGVPIASHQDPVHAGRRCHRDRAAAGW